MRESKVECYFKARCEAAGFLVRKLKWIAHRGAPDRIVIGGRKENKVHFVELKAPGKDLDEHQAREHNRMKDKGAEVWLLNSTAGVDDFIDVLTADPYA